MGAGVESGGGAVWARLLSRKGSKSILKHIAGAKGQKETLASIQNFDNAPSCSRCAVYARRHDADRCGSDGSGGISAAVPPAEEARREPSKAGI
jgi:hypothetical protein